MRTQICLGDLTIRWFSRSCRGGAKVVWNLKASTNYPGDNVP